MGIMDLLTGGMAAGKGQSANDNLGKVLAIGLPIVLMAMRTKSQNDTEAEKLGKALGDHESRRGGNVFERLEANDREDGDKILGHVLGDDRSKVIQEVARKTGVSPEEVEKILSQASPAMMEELAVETQGNRSPDGIREAADKELKQYQQNPQMPDLNDLLSGVLGGMGSGGGKALGDVLKKIL